MKAKLLRKHIALTQEHGSWVFLFSPLLIGLFAGGRWRPASGYLLLGAVAGFLFKQPLTVAVKVYSGRRRREELPAAFFWMGVYGLLALVGLAGLWAQGQGYLMWLALPGIPVLGWYLYLVSRRAERRQIGVEVVASGVLALAAPAAYWVGAGAPAREGWLLWILVWLQSAASIVYAALRLEQRVWRELPPLRARLNRGRRALLYVTFNLLLVFALALGGWVPGWLIVPYGLQWAEDLWGTIRPAVGWRPTRVGLRQLAVSSLFTLAFILAWGRG